MSKHSLTDDAKLGAEEAGENARRPVETPSVQAPRLSAQQVRIHRRLHLVGPGPAAFFLDACTLMEGSSPLRAISHLVGHLLREIKSALCAVLLPEDFKKSGGGQEHLHKVTTILDICEIPHTDHAAQAWLAIAGGGGFAGKAHRDGLAPPSPVEDGFREVWQHSLRFLDAILDRLESRFAAQLPRVEKLLEIADPSNEHARMLRQKIPNNRVLLGAFFGKNSNPRWLAPLAANGFFRFPPEPDIDDRGYAAFPTWPESEYLARIARTDRAAAEQVLEIVLSIPMTANVRVHQDCVDAALGMPADLAAKLVPKAVTWVSSPYQLTLPLKLGELVSHLARQGKAAEALELSRALLMLHPADEARVILRHPRAAFGAWEYEQILTRHVTDLAVAAGRETVVMLADLLQRGLELRADSDARECYADFSYVWRSAIERDAENHVDDLANALVSALRDASARVLHAEPALAPALFAEMEARRWPVFRRLVLHLIRVVPEIDLAEGATRLLDRETLMSADTRHEFSLLVRHLFPRMSDEHRQELLRMIDEGPDIKAVEVSEEERSCYSRVWKRDRLSALSGLLPSDWQDTYLSLLREFGEPEHPDVAVFTSEVIQGPTSPWTSAQMAVGSVDDLVANLQTWPGSSDFMGPSPEGVAREIACAVSAAPERFAPQAMNFVSLDPTYVHGVVSGFRDAAREGQSFAWAPVAALCLWVVRQPRELPPEAKRPAPATERDPHWGWTRMDIARLLQEGFQRPGCQLSATLRKEVWSILEVLVEDPNPTPEDDGGELGRGLDPLTLSINSTRGEALRAAIEYGLWVRRSNPAAAQPIGIGFEEFPELRTVLEAHLDIAKDPASSVRSVYGQLLPRLIMLDKEWVASRLDAIFPSEPQRRAHWDAAWFAYLVSWEAYDDVFRVLRSQYGVAVEHVGESKTRTALRDPDERLAEHLMQLYIRGRLALDDALLQELFARSEDRLRSHALQYVGRLARERPDLSGDAVPRLAALWESRMQTASASEDAPRFRKELSAFGWWFASGRFDENWAIANILAVIGAKVIPKPVHLVLKYLAVLAPGFPLEAIRCVQGMVEVGLETMMVHEWEENVRLILQAGLGGPNVTAQEAAAELINRLVARGDLTFRDLLPA